MPRDPASVERVADRFVVALALTGIAVISGTLAILWGIV